MPEPITASPEFVVKDSGERQEFETGSRRDTRTGKGRFDLIPTYPMKRLARLYEAGAAKYGDRNWEKGQPLMRYLDSASRHLNNLIAGEPEEDHASAIVFNIFGYIYTLQQIETRRLPAELDDRPPAEPRIIEAAADTLQLVIGPWAAGETGTTPLPHAYCGKLTCPMCWPARG